MEINSCSINMYCDDNFPAKARLFLTFRAMVPARVMFICHSTSPEKKKILKALVHEARDANSFSSINLVFSQLACALRDQQKDRKVLSC